MSLSSLALGAQFCNLAATNEVRHYNCQGPSFDASYPGYSNLIYDVPGFNDQISSFRCDY